MSDAYGFDEYLSDDEQSGSLDGNYTSESDYYFDMNGKWEQHMKQLLKYDTERVLRITEKYYPDSYNKIRTFLYRYK
jgi:hypothetical protein